MTIALVLGALLAVACVVFVARPFLREPGARRGDDRLDESDELERRRLGLAEERDRTLAALKELEFDHRTGKISDDDYRAVVGPLRRRAAEMLRALDVRASDGRAAPDRPRLVELPTPAPVPEPYPPPAEPPRPVHIPEPVPVPSEPPEPARIPEPSPEPSPEIEPHLPEPADERFDRSSQTDARGKPARPHVATASGAEPPEAAAER